jgi:hypothetical protein
MILKAWVIEPAVVKTVSYFKLSTVTVTWASGLVIKDSFLQANKKMAWDKISKADVAFIAIKNSRRNRDYRTA